MHRLRGTVLARWAGFGGKASEEDAEDLAPEHEFANII